AFRYISNSRLGLGYVWNAPPFHPVEGYSSFWWVVLLDGVWRLTGIEPPDAANAISLVFALGTLALGTLLILKMPLEERFARWRPLWLSLALIGILSNRTFLAWTSSGLETPLFNFLFTGWVTACVLRPRNVALLSTAAALVALTRPDGYLAVAATA